MEGHARAILADSTPPDCRSSEASFDRLQATWTGVPEYGYDPFSTWKRGAERATALLALSARLQTPGGRVLEAGCGDGMTGSLLAGFGHEVTLADAEDWRDARAKPLAFLVGDLGRPGLLPRNHFDLVCSYNAFEHFAEPEAVLRQLVLSCRPGSLLYFEFGPLYCGPWGLHAYRTLRMPYPQYLYSREFIDRKLEQLGVEDLGRKRQALQPVNGWRWKRFSDLWQNSGCEVVRFRKGLADPENLRVITAFPEAFRGRGLSLEDVLTQSLTVVLRTPV